MDIILGIYLLIMIVGIAEAILNGVRRDGGL